MSFEPNDDFSVWTLTLRSGIEFSDGTPLNAEAVVNSISAAVDIGNSGLRREWGNYIGVDADEKLLISAVDDLTVEFTLNAPYSAFWYAGVQYGPIFAPAYLDELLAGNEDALPVGAGPFKFDGGGSFAPGEEIHLVRNENYWDGVPLLDGVRFRSVPGPEATLQAFEAGDTDMALFQGVGQWREANEAGYDSYAATGYSNSVSIVMRQVGDSPFADDRVRLAFAKGFDFDFWDDRVWEGNLSAIGQTGTGPFLPGTRFYDEDNNGIPYDPEEAKRLLDEVKAETDWDGTIEYTCDVGRIAGQEEVALQAMLEPIGFKVVTVMDPDRNSSTDRVHRNRDFQTGCYTFAVVDANPFRDLNNRWVTGGSSNPGEISVPELDEGIAVLRVADPATTVETVQAIVKAGLNAGIQLIVGANTPVVVFDSDVKGLEWDVMNLGFMPILHKVWLDR